MGYISKILPFLLAAFGCSTTVDMGELPQSHPAHPQANAAPATERSALLERHLPPPDIDPYDDAGQHDHMQQKGHDAADPGTTGMQHGPHDADHQQHNHSGEGGRLATKAVYACPKHAEEQSPYTGNCIRCNRPLERKSVSVEPPHAGEKRPAKESHSPYSCTQHPALSLKSPGLCPVCGMTLVERKDGES